ncbi:Hint domain-containing protein [Sedimentimonas flavescens]|uniref:Hint domain-containing protein n=1 Tax=Sedimentimonas flavescens TaxID=2851012 RepID=UPI0021A8BECA|nr:Hint domain-containing protein [Sedimentimonas flavescens]MCT2539662.1 Hint domain-containing protein [Sedimentimonas flavescens]
MATYYTDQFWIIDPSAPPPAGSTLTVYDYQILDRTDDQLINALGTNSQRDVIDGSRIVRSYPGDTVTVTYADGSTATITGATFYLADGREVFTPTDGSVLHDATLVRTTYVTVQGSMNVGSLAPVCLTRGCMIDTTDGSRPVETLRAGDLILSPTGAPQALRAVFSRKIDPRELRSSPALLPVRIAAGALGPGLPTRDLLVSRQHRMLVRSTIAARMFGAPEVLVPAIMLTALPGIAVEETATEVEYFHLVFDQHALIMAENAPTESLFPGKQALRSLAPAAVEELFAIFPELAGQRFDVAPARPLAQGRKARHLIERHAANGKPLLGSAAA